MIDYAEDACNPPKGSLAALKKDFEDHKDPVQKILDRWIKLVLTTTRTFDCMMKIHRSLPSTGK